MIWLVMCLQALSGTALSSQKLTEEQRAYLNKEIRFLNESVHRMVIVFQVYENYNSQISTHVDLPAHEGIQNTSKHLPTNLFADNNMVRKGDSPYKLYKELAADPIKNSLPFNSWPLVNNTKAAIDNLNQDRSKMDHTIDHADLEQFSTIQTIFEDIEKAVDHYDKVRNSVKQFEQLYQDVFHDIDLSPERKQVYTALLELHYDIKKLVRRLRDESRSGVQNNIGKVEKELKWLKACINKIETVGERSDLMGAIVSIEKLAVAIRDYLSDSSFPEEYAPYGSGYYVHNYELLPKINEYGSGYVWKLEEFFKKYDWPVLNLLEEPHYLKVVYPERIPVDVMTAGELPPDQDIRQIEAPPLPALENIVVATDVSVDQEEVEKPKPSPAYKIVVSESVFSDSSWLALDLYDHFKYDADKVSVSFNGEWIMNNVSLKKEGQTVYLELVPGKENIVIIKADNLGWTTPNTIGVAYAAKNTENSIRILKDLNLHQAIELKIRM